MLCSSQVGRQALEGVSIISLVLLGVLINIRKVHGCIVLLLPSSGGGGALAGGHFQIAIYYPRRG